jgi:hypothetical protein
MRRAEVEAKVAENTAGEVGMDRVLRPWMTKAISCRWMTILQIQRPFLLLQIPSPPVSLMKNKFSLEIEFPFLKMKN